MSLGRNMMSSAVFLIGLYDTVACPAWIPCLFLCCCFSPRSCVETVKNSLFFFFFFFCGVGKRMLVQVDARVKLHQNHSNALCLAGTGKQLKAISATWITRGHTTSDTRKPCTHTHQQWHREHLYMYTWKAWYGKSFSTVTSQHVILHDLWSSHRGLCPILSVSPVTPYQCLWPKCCYARARR